MTACSATLDWPTAVVLCVGILALCGLVVAMIAASVYQRRPQS